MTEPTIRQLGLSPKQLAAFCALFGIDMDTGQQTWAGVDQMLYGGAAGGGKTFLDAVAALWFAQQYPGAKIGLFRRTLPELEDTLQAEVLGLLPEGAGSFNERKHTLTLKKGKSQLFFCYCDTENDVYKHQGKEFHLIVMDELTHFSEAQVRYLLSRWRVAKAGIPRKFLGSTNPGNIGHEWVKRYWIDGHEPFAAWYHDKERVSRVFIPARLEDNPHIRDREEYEQTLLAMGGNLSRALRWGEWDLQEGAFFTGFSRHTHVIEPYQPPPHYRRWRSIDWGMHDPAVCLWCCSEPSTGRVIVYRELRERGLTTTQFKEKILSLSGDEQIDYTVADYSGRARSHDTNLSMFDIFAQPPYPLTIQPAQKNRAEGWRRVQDALRDLPPDGDEAPQPGLLVMKNCPWTIKELGAAIIHPSNNEDIADPTKDDDRRDDCLDTLRYSLMSRNSLLRVLPSTKREREPRIWNRLAGRGR